MHMLQQMAACRKHPVTGQGLISTHRLVLLCSQLTFPQSPDWANPDRVQFGTKSGIGAAGTFNHLTDAILDVEATRLMYFRRLRTLADKYYGQGKLRQVRVAKGDIRVSW